MVHRIIDDIEIPFFIWKKMIAKEKVKRNLSFDTETIDGKVFLIFNSDGEFTNIKEFKDLIGLLKWLNNDKYRKSVNWFYNLEYDTNAILKFLSFGERQHIAEFNYVDVEDFRISIIPRKELKISVIKNDKMIRSTIFYDLAQFYNFKKLSTLAESTIYNKVYVSDISALNIDKYYNDMDYYKLLNERCLIDCQITNIKADEFTNNINNVVKTNNYKSNASIARKSVLTSLTHNLKMPCPKLMDMALKSYHAGHIETCQLGLFDNVHNYDIKSAYPSFIAELPETKGAYLENREYEPDASYSYFDINVDYENDFLSPLWYSRSNNNYHLNGKMNVIISKSELEYLNMMGYTLKINTAHHLMPNKYIEKPFYNIIHDLYDARLKAKNETDKVKRDIQLVYKIILNSIYGVTLNTINKKILSIYATDLSIDINGFVKYYEESYKATNMYNPVYGNDITARTRSKLFYDFRNKLYTIISVNTDGVFMTEKVNNLKISEKLGDYGYKLLPKNMVMGSGRYFIFDKDGTINNESRFRGIPRQPIDLHTDMINNKNKSSLKVTKESPIKLKESLKNKSHYNLNISSFPIQNYSLIDNFNSFMPKTKDINFRTNKRYWYDEIKNIGELWDKQIQSRPFNISEIK